MLFKVLEASTRGASALVVTTRLTVTDTRGKIMHLSFDSAEFSCTQYFFWIENLPYMASLAEVHYCIAAQIEDFKEMFPPAQSATLESGEDCCCPFVYAHVCRRARVGALQCTSILCSCLAHPGIPSTSLQLNSLRWSRGLCVIAYALCASDAILWMFVCMYACMHE